MADEPYDADSLRAAIRHKAKAQRARFRNGLWPFFFLAFSGISVLILGLQYAQYLLDIFGGILIAAAMITGRHLGVRFLAGAFAGSLAGALVGMLVGVFAGGVARTLAGVICGGILGAFGALFVIGAMSNTVPFPIPFLVRKGVLPELSFIPAAIKRATFVAALILGAYFGAKELGESIARIFRAIGGGAFSGAVLGITASVLWWIVMRYLEEKDDLD